MKSIPLLYVTAFMIMSISLISSGVYAYFLIQSDQVLRLDGAKHIQQRALQLSDAVKQEATAFIQGFDLATRQLRDAYVESQENFDKSVHTVLSNYPSDAIQFILVFDAAGYLAYSSDGTKTNIYFGDREHFRVHADSAEDKLFISRPVIGRVGNTWVILFTRAIRHDGQFRGVIVLSLRPEYIARNLAVLNLNPGDHISLLRTDGFFLTRSCSLVQALGKAVPADRPFLDPSAAPGGTYHAIDTLDGVPRVYAWQRLDPWPLVVTVALDETAELNPLEVEIAVKHRQGVVAISMILIFASGIAAVLMWAERQRKRLIKGEVLLATEAKRFKSLLMTASDGIHIIDENGNLLEASESFFKMLGYKPEDRAKLNVKDWDAQFSHEELERLLPEQIRNGGLFETRHKRNDGSVIDVEINCLGVELEGQHYLYASSRDITKRKRIEMDLRKLNEELELARDKAEAGSRAKSEFLAMMSHEIRTPMNAILGLVYLLNQTTLDACQKDYVHKTLSSAQSLLGILNDILDLSKVQAGKIDLIEEPFRLDDLMKSLAAMASANARDKNIEVLFDIAPDTPLTLIGDSLRLQQVLTNLAGNAIKFTDRGEVVLSVEVTSCDAMTVDLLFRVRDTGIGIAPDNQEMIFHPFSQADNTTSRRFGGSGLGLAISRRLVELAGGRIWCESTPGQGSTFFVALRFGRSSLVLDKLTARPTVSTDLKVLIADDNQTARQVMTAMVAPFGWKLVVASSGQQALEEIDHAMKSEPFDLLLLDWLMPDVGGNEIVQHIKAHQAPEAAPLILIVTAFEYERVRRDSKGEPLIRAVLTKPVTASSLFDALTLVRPTAANVRTLPSPPSNAVSMPMLGLSVLLVEDNSINQMVARRILEFAGAEVVVAADGIKALEILSTERHHFDAVLMDIQMPGMDGYDTTRAIRKNMGLTDLPIIAMTANALASDRDQCLAVGMDDHIGKPFIVDQMIATIINHTKVNVGCGDLSPSSVKNDVSLPSNSAIDVREALTRAMGDSDLLKILMGEFAQTYSEIANTFYRLLIEGNLRDLARGAHDLKGVSGTLGARQLSTAAKVLQTAAESGNLEEVRSACDDVRNLLPTVIMEARRIADGGSLDDGRSISAPNVWEGRAG